MLSGGGRLAEAGVMTFLMTDVEGSTRLWDADPEAMARALGEHDRIVEGTVSANRGVFVKSRGEGDSTFSVFEDPCDAAVAAVEIRVALDEAVWPVGTPIVVRSALHTGRALARDGDFYGPTVNRAARIRALAVGGQILMSAVTAELVRCGLSSSCELVDLGSFELRGLTAPERVFALAQPNRPRWSILAGRCPYPGLVAFQAEDHDNFFGRQALVGALLQRLVDKRRVVVVGPSGSGKSSLMQAGLLGALPERYRSVLVTPGHAPFDELADRLASAAGIDTARAVEELRRDAAGVFRRGARDDGLFVLAVDQLEELFTQCDDPDQRRGFLDVLVAAASSEWSALAVTVRADFYGAFVQHRGFAELISTEVDLLGPLQGDELREAIEQPARRNGLRLELGLVEAIIADVEGEPGALPLLSHALRETWRRREGNILTLAGYRAAGGVQGAIARTADAIYDSLAEPEQDTMRAIFVRLTEPGNGTAEDTRRRLALSELVSGQDNFTRVLEVLVDARLVTTDIDSVEVAHEALIREWPRLRQWLDDDREGLRLLRDLARAADDWRALDQDPGALYRGARLAATIEWLAGDPTVALTAPEREFLDASRAVHEQEAEATRARLAQQTAANRRMRRLLTGVAVALVLVLVAGVFALLERNRADDQASQARAASKSADVGRLVAESEVLRTRDRSLSTLLAVAANRLSDTPSTRGALETALASEPRLRVTLFGRYAPARSVAFTPDGRDVLVRSKRGIDFYDVATRRRSAGLRLGAPGLALTVSGTGTRFATGDDHGTIEQWDTAHRTRIGDPIDVDGPVAALAYAPDGGSLAVAIGTFGNKEPTTTPSVVVFNAVSGQQRPVLVGGQSRSVNAIAYSPDGRILATGSNDNSVVLHDAGSGQPLMPPLEAGGEVSSLAFSPDGTRVAVASLGSDAVVFDVATGQAVSPPLPTGSVLGNVAFSRDGRRLVTLAQEATIWDTANYTPIGTHIDHGKSGAVLAYSPVDDLFAIAGFDGSLSFWEPSAQPLFTRPLGVPGVLGGTYSPDGRLVAVPTTNDVTLYDARTMAAQFGPLTVPTGSALSVGATPVMVAFNKDGTLVAVAGLGAILRLYSTRDGSQVGHDIDIGSSPPAMAFSPDGDIIATGGTQGDVRLIDVDTGTIVGPLRFPATDYVLSVSWSPNGRHLLATTGTGQALVFDGVNTSLPVARPLPDSKDDVSVAAYSPDGSLLATAGTLGTVQLRDPTTMRPITPPLQAASGIVFQLQFSADGHYLALADTDLVVRFVDIPARAPLGDSIRIGSFGRMSFAPDKPRVILPAPDGTVLMSLSPRRWRTLACQTAGRDLTQAERNEYLHGSERQQRFCPGTA